MNSMRAAVLTALVLGLSTGRAAAGPIIVDGGPASAAGKKRLVAALAATADLAVCFRAGAARVRVELKVAADGRIERSAAHKGGAAGQCVAGVLAVQKLPAESAGYRVVVNLDGAGGGAAGARSQESIDADLADLRGDLDACQARDRSKAGEVSLAFLIKPDGTLVDVKVSSSTLASPAIEKCLVGVLSTASLSARPGAKAVAYTLSMALAGGGSGGAARPAGHGGLLPQKDGPLDAALIQKAIRDRQGPIEACYRAQASKNPKLAGTVTIRFSVYGDGKTYNAAVKESTLASPAVESCLVKIFATLRFPAEPARAKTRVFYPLRFGAP